MPRMIDCDCQVCDYKIRDLFMQSPPDVFVHKADDGTIHTMEYVYLPRAHAAEWDDRQAVVVYQKSDGTYSYPGRNNLPTPPGCERVTLRSLRAVEAFEKKAGVRSEIAWYDAGTGRDASEDVPRRTVTEDQRLKRFMESWQG